MINIISAITKGEVVTLTQWVNTIWLSECTFAEA